MDINVPFIPSVFFFFLHHHPLYLSALLTDPYASGETLLTRTSLFVMAVILTLCLYHSVSSFMRQDFVTVLGSYFCHVAPGSPL